MKNSFPLQLPVFTTSESNDNFTKKRQFSCLNIVYVCLQGSSRSGRQFGVTVETLTGSHLQISVCFSQWSSLSIGKSNACHFTFSSSLDYFTEGGSLEERKTPRFLIYISFFCLGRYLHVLNLPAFVYTCWLVCKLTIHWIAKYDTASSIWSLLVRITEEESMGYIAT